MSKELTSGKKTYKQIAEWMGITPVTFSKYKQKYLEELNNFAKYHLEGKRVIIQEVIDPIYSKQKGKQYEKIKAKINETWDTSGLDTCVRVGKEIYNSLSYTDKDFHLKDTTVVKYTRKGRTELWGIPFSEKGGTLGKCIYVWCKKDPDTGRCLPLTKEEKAIKTKLQTLYFGDATEKAVFVKAMIETGEVTEEEGWNTFAEMIHMDNNDHFLSFLKDLQSTLGCQIVRGTQVFPKIAEKNFEEPIDTEGVFIES